MKRETEIIGNFFRHATFSADGSYAGTSGDIYRDLVYHRFFEALSSVYPLTKNLLGPRVFGDCIKKFISEGISGEFIRDMTEKFGNFLAGDESLKDNGWLVDLCWYEFTDARLRASEDEALTKNQALLHNQFQLSPLASIKQVSHEVYGDPLKKIDPTGVVMYYDLEKNEVCYRTISPFIVTLIEKMHDLPYYDALKNTCRDYSLNDEACRDSENLVRGVIEDLLDNAILVQSMPGSRRGVLDG